MALIEFSQFGATVMGGYSRWALIRGWALTRINTVSGKDISGFSLKVFEILKSKKS